MAITQYLEMNHGSRSRDITCEQYYCVVDPNISLWIALQKIFTLLGGLHDVGLVYGDLKIENVMIQKENGEYTVRLIDMGSINEKDKDNDFICTAYIAAPEGVIRDVDSDEYAWNQKLDVFANAVELPHILFGGIAENIFQNFTHTQKILQKRHWPVSKELRVQHFCQKNMERLKLHSKKSFNKKEA